jgi:hypothetical protein
MVTLKILPVTHSEQHIVRDLLKAAKRLGSTCALRLLLCRLKSDERRNRDFAA